MRNLRKGKDSVTHFEMRRLFSDRLKRRMDALDITQSELGRRLGCHSTTVNRWFSPDLGYSMPEGTLMALLPAVLGVSGHWLLTGQGPMLPPQESEAASFREGATVAYAEVQALAASRIEGLRLGTSLPLTGPTSAEAVRAAEYRAALTREAEERAAHTPQPAPTRRKGHRRGAG